MDFYLSLLNVAAAIFMLLGAIFTLLGKIFTFLGSQFYKVYGKIIDQEKKIIASLPSAQSFLPESPVIAPSSLPLSPPSPPSLPPESPLMASSSLPLSTPSLVPESSLIASSSLPISPPSPPSLPPESPLMASSSLPLSTPSLVPESSLIASSSLPISPPSPPSLPPESPLMASSSLPFPPPSVLRESQIMASSSLLFSPPSVLPESPVMAFSSLPLSTPYSPSPLCEIPTMASSSLSLSSQSLLSDSPLMDSSYLSLSLPSSSPPRSWEHDVFPSFHGPDVRKSFLSHIQKEFQRNGILLFIDNNMERGKYVGPELKKAIRGSKFAIVLLSKNYAYSSWCLDELVEIMNKVEGQTVITIFYEVAPADVKYQTGDFGKVFEETCQGQTKEKIMTWRKSLEGVATIAGYHYHSNNWIDEATMIKKLTAHISKMLNRMAPSPDMDRLIGMGDHMERMQLLLRLDLNEARMIGIWGPAGIGKSTIAKFLFHKLSNCFQFRGIMMDIKGNYPINCLNEGSAQLQLQNQLLSQVINHKADTMITHLEVAPQRLNDKKVLLVLDDVDRPAQLEALAREVQWFGPGSRIIITSEDLTLLKAHGINYINKVDFPSDDEARQMFCMYAFGQTFPKDGFSKLCHEITYLVGKLPLGLKIMGSYFRGMPKKEWTRVLPKLWSRLNGEIESILRFSYDALCDEDKDLFLHIACFFNHEKVEKVEEHLAKKFSYVREGIRFLADKSLISINLQCIEMHSLLAQLGKDIVRKQYVCKPGKRQFLVDDKDIGEVFNDSIAITRSVIGINSKKYLTWNNSDISERAFEGMSNLQFLRLSGGSCGLSNILNSPRHMKYISPKLQLLDWTHSPLTCLPFIVNLEFLVELRMPNSKLQKLWEGIKLLRNLKWIDLSHSENLKELPDLSTATKLEELNLSFCSSLVKLPSVGNAVNLHILDLNCCSSLVELHSSIGNAINLQTLILKYCSSLVGLPSSIGNATNLIELDLRYCTSLVKLPSSIGNLHRLSDINLEGCSKLEDLPTNINFKSLHRLNLTNCSLLKRFPDISTQIQYIMLRGTAIEEVPSSVRSGHYPIGLHMSYSENLQAFPQALDNITDLHLTNTEVQEIGPWVKGFSRLRRLVLNEMQNLVSLSQLPDSLEELDAENCVSLERLDCSFSNPYLRSLSFGNCFRLNQEARDLIIRTSTRKFSVLPGGEVPPCFTYRAYGSSLTVKVNEKHVGTSKKFKACILFVNESVALGKMSLSCNVTSKQKALTSCRWTLHEAPIKLKHLYIFEVKAEEVVTSTELVFEFKLNTNGDHEWIKECGIFQLL